jgi:hypothetical protein
MGPEEKKILMSKFVEMLLCKQSCKMNLSPDSSG